MHRNLEKLPTLQSLSSSVFLLNSRVSCRLASPYSIYIYHVTIIVESCIRQLDTLCNVHVEPETYTLTHTQFMLFESYCLSFIFFFFSFLFRFVAWMTALRILAQPFRNITCNGSLYWYQLLAYYGSTCVSASETHGGKVSKITMWNDATWHRTIIKNSSSSVYHPRSRLWGLRSHCLVVHTFTLGTTARLLCKNSINSNCDVRSGALGERGRRSSKEKCEHLRPRILEPRLRRHLHRRTKMLCERRGRLEFNFLNLWREREMGGAGMP